MLLPYVTHKTNSRWTKSLTEKDRIETFLKKMQEMSSTYKKEKILARLKGHGYQMFDKCDYIKVKVVCSISKP